MPSDPADMAMSDLLSHLRASRVVARYFTSAGDLVQVRGGDGPDDKPDDAPDDKPDDSTDDKPAADSEVEKWKALARKHESESKKAKGDLNKLQKATATDEERKLLEAKEAGRTEALSTVGSKLVAAEIRAESAGRLKDEQRTALIDSLDLTKFLTDDGEVDTDKVTALIDGIAGPKSDKDDKEPFPDLGQGRRQRSDAKPSVASGRDLFAEHRGGSAKK